MVASGQQVAPVSAASATLPRAFHGWITLSTLARDYSMSIAALDWVFKQYINPSWLKFTLVALADCAGDEGECWPSIAHICATTSLNRKTVIKALDQLTELGYLIDTGERRGQTKQIKVYVLKDTVGGTLKESRLYQQRVPCRHRKSTAQGTRNLSEPSLNLLREI